jgi:hypothetical protein
MIQGTRVISIKVAVRDSITAFEKAIETTLQIYGRPLNWIVTDVDVKQQTATVDALIMN